MKYSRRKYEHFEDGFSYIDVMIAIVILLVGVLAMASTLTSNLVRSLNTEKQMIAKQVAVSTIESILSARDIERPAAQGYGIKGWDSVGNVNKNIVDGVAQGIFLNGWCPIRQDLGLDGVAGTADDACPSDSICSVTGEPPNNSTLLSGYERQIVITDLPDAERPTPPNAIARRRIDVSIRYFSNQISRQEVVSTIITNY
jgi:type II secretory pathway pseudopilin PulG